MSSKDGDGNTAPPDRLDGYFAPMLPDDARDVWVPFINCDIVSDLWKNPDPIQFFAKDQKSLIDTGANACGISSEMAERLNLRPLYEGASIGADHDQRLQTYSMRIRVGQEPKVHVVPVVAFPKLAKASFQILLGWPVLHKYQLLLNQKKGSVSLIREP